MASDAPESALRSLPPYMTLGANYGAKLLLRRPGAADQPVDVAEYFFFQRSKAFFGSQFDGEMPYDMVGGLISPDEELAVGAVREATEELHVGVRLDVDKHGKPVVLDQVLIPLGFREGEVTLFRTILSGVLLDEPHNFSEEHEPGSGRWLTLGQALAELYFDPTTEAALRRILDLGQTALGSTVERPS